MGCCSSGGGGEAQSTQTVYTQSQLPGWVNDAAQANYGEAKTLADQPYQAYGGERIAQLNPDQQQAMAMTRSSMGQWQPTIDAATGIASGVAGSDWTQADQQAYQNPYRQQVIDTSVAEANRQGDVARQQLARSAPTASAWGGDRQAILEAEQGRNQMDTTNRMVAGLNDQGYQQAVAQYNADQAKKLQGANLMGNLAGAGQALGFADINALMQTGGMQQGQEQANLDLGYADFLNQKGHPFDMLNFQTSMLNAQPYNTSSTQTSSGYGTPRAEPNNWAQLIGGLGAFAGAAGQSGWF